MHKISIPLIFSILILFSSCLAPGKKEKWMKSDNSDWPRIALTNFVQFPNTPVYLDTLDCAFLIDTGTDTFAVTSKTILWNIHPKEMTGIDFGDIPHSWVIYPRQNRSDSLIVTGIVNCDSSEAIEGDLLNQNWLIFSVKRPIPDIQPLKIRRTPLRKYEKLYSIGWAYRERDLPQRIHKGIYFREHEIFKIAMFKGKTSRLGWNGAPVIDSKGYLVGILSPASGYMDLTMFCSTDYLISILSELKLLN